MHSVLILIVPVLHGYAYDNGVYGYTYGTCLWKYEYD